MSKSPENSVRRYGINAVSSVATRILQLTVLVWVNQYLLRRIDPQEYSLYPLVLSLMVFADLFRTTFTAGLGRYIVEADSRDDNLGVTRIVSSMAPLLMLLALFFAIAGSLAAWQLDRIITVQPDYLREARVMLLILVFSLCMNVVGAPFAEGLYARQRFVALNAIGLGCEALRVAILLALLFGVSTRVMWLVVASACSGAVSLFLQIVITRRILPSARFRWDCRSMKTALPLIRFGAWTTVGGISSLISSTFPALFLNRFATATDVAAFHLGRLPDYHIRNVADAVSGPAQPALTRMYGLHGERSLYDLYYRGGRYYLWLTLLLVAPLLGFGKEIIGLYVGAKYEAAASVFFAILAAYPFLWASAMFYQVAHAMGRVRPYYICDLVIQIVTLGALWYAVAIRDLGAPGAALAIGMSHGLLHIFLVWPVGLLLVGGKWMAFARQTLLPGVLPFALALATCYWARTLVAVNSWLMIGIGSLVALGIYLAVLLAFCLDPVDRGLVGRMMGRVKAVLSRAAGAMRFKTA